MVGYGVRRRPWLAVAAVLGLAGSLLAAGVAPPAGAAAGEADNEAVYSACVGPALESAGLVDVAGSFAEDAVNCLAHFEITRGRTDTEYDPGAPVLRWQMALFLARAAAPAGITLPAVPDQNFTDIEEVFEGARTAIAQMAHLGIMLGYGGSSTSFRPDAQVSRAEMAEMLDAFLGGAELGLGALGGSVDELSDVSPDDDVFDDIEGTQRGQHAAIRRMFEAGVAKGTADGRFNPGALVTRGQMAVFITRMLAHTVARPRGVTVQAAESEATTGESVELAVSVRDSGLMAMPDAVVDVFSAPDPDDAFGEDGRCSADAVSAVGGSKVCEITVGDSSTGPSGDLELSADDLAESLTVWAWTGDVGDVYDSDDMSAPSVRIAVTKPGTKLKVTDDMPEGATTTSFGQRVAFTLQVVDEDGKEAAVEGVPVTVAVVETVTNVGPEPDVSSTTSSTSSYKTDSKGSIELSFRQTDPRSGSGNTGDKAWLDLDITPGSKDGVAFELDDKTTLKKAGREAGAAEGDAAVYWRDAAPQPTALTLSQDVVYHEATVAGSGASHRITAKLTDQYGQGIGRASIFFRSDDQEGVGAAGDGLAVVTYDEEQVFWQNGAEHVRFCDDPIITLDNEPLYDGLTALRCLDGEPKETNRRTTRPNGEAVFSYSRDSDRIGIETIWASYELTPARGGADAEVLVSNRIYHFWAKSADSGWVSGRLLAADADANRAVIYAPEGPMIFEYDSNDHLDSLDGPDLYANFHEHMGRSADARPPTHLRVDGYQDRARAVNHLILSREQAMQPSSEVISLVGEGARIAASDTGVVVIGSGRDQVLIFGGADDADPQIIESDERGNSLGYDVAISDDGAVIAAGAPYHTGGGRGGAVFVYTRGAGGVYTQTAVLSGEESASWMIQEQTGGSDQLFGSGVDVSGDGRTIVVTAPGDLRARAIGAQCDSLQSNPPSLCIEGFIRVFEMPDTGWADDGGGDTDTSFGFLPSDLSLVGSRNGISVSDDGSVVAVGSPGIRSIDGSSDAGGVYVYERPSSGWSTGPLGPPRSADAKLTLAGADAHTSTEGYFGGYEGRRLGAGVRISGDGSTVVLPGYNIFIDSYEPDAVRQELYVFDRPAGGWTGGLTIDDYEVLTPDGLEEDEFFGRWVDVNGDGSEVISGRYLRQDGDYRGSVVLFARSGGGWSVNSEFLGGEAGTGYGRYAVFAGDDAITAMDRFGGRLTTISR